MMLDPETILYGLKKRYPKAGISLHYRDPWELLVATILSAQCTDQRVNIVTSRLFKKYKGLRSYASADKKVFENDIRSTGFFHEKAKNIISSAVKILKDHHGRVPDYMEGLMSLPGVARKTSNIVLYHAYGKTEGIAVDTHVKRLSRRMGLTESDVPEKIEKDLMGKYKKKDWGRLTGLMIAHGRKICRARNPLCDSCFLSDSCPSSES